MSARKEELKRNLVAVKSKIAEAAANSGRELEEIKLIVVTKTFPLSDVEALYELGVRDFGENRDQEGSAKAPHIPEDATWHFQGQIQSNKLKSISGVNEELLGPHEPELNWISTKDRLPEAGEWIIYSTGTPLFTYVGRYCNEADPMPSLPNWLKWEQVKHWMPLPEPPKEINQ